MMMMMMMIVGSLVFCSSGVSGIVALVNEHIIDFDFLDFLLISGWGAPGASDPSVAPGDPEASVAPEAGAQMNCIDTAIDTCKSVADFTSDYTVDDHDTCVATLKTQCIASGGTWTSANGEYPISCEAGARIDCLNLRGSKRKSCIEKYRKGCKIKETEKETPPSSASPTVNQSTSGVENCVVFYGDEDKELDRYCLKGAENGMGEYWVDVKDEKKYGYGGPVRKYQVGRNLNFTAYENLYMNNVEGNATPGENGGQTGESGTTTKCKIISPWTKHHRSPSSFLTLKPSGCSIANYGFQPDSTKCHHEVFGDGVTDVTKEARCAALGSWKAFKK